MPEPTLPGQPAHAATAPLQLALLGTPVVTWMGHPLPMPRRQTRALLYRLAADPQPVARAQLCYLFWPDIADGTARRNLTRLLVLLRQALPQPTLLLTEDETVLLDRSRLWCDTREFLRLAATPPTRGPAQAADLVRGPFLEGFGLPDCPEFESWMDRERRTWERRLFDTLTALLEAYSAAHDYAAAIAIAHRYLQADELAEDIHRRLIALYAAAGERRAALRQFEQCTVILERELGVSPLPETRAVYEAARGGEARLGRRDAENGSDPGPIRVAPRAAQAAPSPSAAGLPVPANPLIGRVTELAEIMALLQRGDVRLLTLSGPGGAGKTRLAIEVARRLAGDFAAGVVFVPLAPLRDPIHLIPALINALGLTEQDDRPPLVRLQDALADRELLLVLDNFEHVAVAAPEVAALSAAAPRLTILATSRARLHITGEHSYLVPPLALPDLTHLPGVEALAQVEAVALFLARVQARVPAFGLVEANAAEVAAICARLDGLPLAIELAAARGALLSPRMLLARLNRSLEILTHGPRDLPERQRTLRATIDWSYRLLDLSEQLLFGRLAVFAGDWDLEAAEAVSDAAGPLAESTLDGLQALLDKHLVQRSGDAGGASRFTMLETIREYALERLTERGEIEAVQRGHAQHYLALADMAAPALRGPEQIAWFDRLDEEHANLSVALTWLLATGDPVQSLRLAGALHWFWFARGYLSEGRSRLNQALARAEGSGLQDDRTTQLILARARYAAGQLATFQGDLATARSQLESAIALCRAMDGRAAQRLLHDALMFLVVTCVWQGDFVAVDPTVTEYNALVLALDEPWTNAMGAFNAGRMQLHQRNDILAAQAYLREAQALLRAVGDIGFLTQVLIDLGTIALATGDLQAAHQSLGEALGTAQAMKDRIAEANVFNNLGEMARLMGNDALAAQHYEASLRLHRDVDAKNEIPRLVHNLGYLALHAGDTILARERFVESLMGFRAIGQNRGMAEPIAGLACLHAQMQTADGARRAARLWGAAHAIYTAERAPVWPADRVEHERYQALARDILDGPAYVAAFAAGAALSADQAVAEALSM